MQVVSHSIGIFRSHHLSLLQGQRRESDGEQITRFGSKLVDVFERVGILRIDDRQAAERTTAKSRIPFMAEWYIHILGFATAKRHV